MAGQMIIDPGTLYAAVGAESPYSNADLTHEGIETRGVRKGGGPIVDIIEDIFAFFYASGGKQNSSSGDDVSCCPACGAELEEDDDGEPYCPDCRE